MKQNNNENEILVECPKCLGLGVVFEPNIENDEQCKLCNGKGKTEQLMADSFDPLNNLIDNKNESDEMLGY